MATLRSIIIFIISLCFTSAIIAQQNKFDIGVEAGSGISMFYGNLINGEKANIAGSAGITFQYNFRKIFSLRAGLVYERKTWVTKGGYSDQTAFLHFDYLTIPLLTRVSFGKKILFFLDVGPYLSFQLKAIGVFSGPKEIIDENTLFKPIDLGLSAGAGIEIPIKERLGITIEARNNVGLINLLREPTYINSPIKSYAAVFLAGFEYKFGARNKE